MSAGEKRKLIRLGSVCIAAGVIVGGVLGARETRQKPVISDMHVLNNTSQPAGGAFKIDLDASFPPNCTPHWTRVVVFPKLPGQKKPDSQLLPSDPVPIYTNGNIPIPTSSIQRCGDLQVIATLEGCGFLSGIFQQLSAHSKPVPVCIGAPQLVLTKVAPK